MAVDIGAEAIDRLGGVTDGWTFINKAGPASINGEITSIDIYVSDSDITGLRVGTFYATNGSTFKCRDSEAISGTIYADTKVTKAVSIAVEIGDYIGLYFTAGRMERDTIGFAGIWYKSGEYIDPNDEVEYGLLDGDAISLGGYITPILAPTVTTQAVTGIGFD